LHSAEAEATGLRHTLLLQTALHLLIPFLLRNPLNKNQLYQTPPAPVICRRDLVFSALAADLAVLFLRQLGSFAFFLAFALPFDEDKFTQSGSVELDWRSRPSWSPILVGDHPGHESASFWSQVRRHFSLSGFWIKSLIIRGSPRIFA
jgi:hypothetical protein